jgi:hypothetical protein
MAKDGRTTLYDDGSHAVNWTNILRFPITARKTGRHNIAGKRYDVWFDGPDEYGTCTQLWWGVRYGDNTQILHCRRLKGDR